MRDRIRIGVLGTARVARTMVPEIQKSDLACVQVIGSRSLEKAKAFGAEFEIPHAVGSYEEVLASDCDAVYVPLPPALHCEWTCRAAEAGKHVLCEKPLATTAAEARTMIEACRQAGIVLLDSVMWYHTERARRMKQIIACGELGDVRQITAAFTFPGDRLAENNIRLCSELGGGSLLDVGWYCVGASLWFMNAMPRRVFAAAEIQHSVDWHLNGLMWFSDQQVASIETGFNMIRRRWIEIAGTAAALVCDDFTRPWNMEKPRFWIHDSHGVSHQNVVPHPSIERCLIDAFCSLIQNHQVVHDWATLSLQTQHVCDVLKRSVLSQQIEPVECLAPLPIR